MKLITKVLFRGLIVVGAFFMSLAANATEWSVVETSGTVRSQNAMASAQLISTGQTFGAGSILSTGFDGRVVLANGSQQIIVGPNSRMSLPVREENGKTRILQELGTLLFKVDKRERKHFRVETPVIAAVVKGTTFTVTAGADAHAVHVAEGAVEVSTRNANARELVTAGRTVRVMRNNPSVIHAVNHASLKGEPKAKRVLENTSDEGVSHAAVEGKVSNDRLIVPATIGAEPLDTVALTDRLVEGTGVDARVNGLQQASASIENNGNQSNAASNARSNAAQVIAGLTSNARQFTDAQNGNAGNGNNGNSNGNGNAGNGNNGNGNGNAGNGNNGNGNGNAGSGNNGNGNGNAGNGNTGNGNGNAGNGNNGNGNGNAGNGNNGNGNANAGSGNNGNGNENAGNGNNGNQSNAASNASSSSALVVIGLTSNSRQNTDAQNGNAGNGNNGNQSIAASSASSSAALVIIDLTSNARQNTDAQNGNAGTGSNSNGNGGNGNNGNGNGNAGNGNNGNANEGKNSNSGGGRNRSRHPKE